MGEEGVVKKMEGATALLGTGCQDRPGPFAPTHSGVSSRTLRNSAVNYHMANRLLRQVVGWFDAGCRQEREVMVRVSTAKSGGQGLRLAERRRMAHLFEKASADSVHSAGKSLRLSLAAPMQRVKELSHPAKEFFAPPDQADVALFREKADVADQVGHAELNGRAAVGHVLAIGREIVAADHAAKGFTQHGGQHRAATRRINVKDGKSRGTKAPSPVTPARIFVPPIRRFPDGLVRPGHRAALRTDAGLHEKLSGQPSPTARD
jgi:hypothetical protein